MRDRSPGVISLAFMSVMVALFAQLGAVALIIGGSVFTTLGSMQGAIVLMLGALFLGLAIASYVVAYALWTGKHWSWAGGVVIFATLIVASALLVVISGNPGAAPLPIISGVAGMWLLSRPAVKAELLGEQVAVEATVPAADGMRGAEVAP
jgi:hypothetical protein